MDGWRTERFDAGDGARLDDRDNGSAETQAAPPRGRIQRSQGRYLSAVGAPLGRAILDDRAG